MPERAFVPVVFLRNLVQLLADEQNLPVERVVQGSGLSWSDLQGGEDAVTTFSNQILIYEHVARFAKLAGIGFRSPSARSFADQGVFGALLTMASSIKEAFDKLRTFIDVVGGLVDYNYVVDGRTVFIRTTMKSTVTPAAHQLITEENLACWKYLALPVSGLESYVQYIELDYARPKHWRMYKDLFPEREIRFGRSHIQVALSVDVLDMAMPSHNPQAFALLEEECKQIVQRMQATTKMLADEYLSSVNYRFWNPQAIADHLHISTRTLRRRLEAEGMSPKEVIDQHKFRLAQHRFAAGDSDAKTALSLGYRDTTSFTRAFMRWSGCSTDEYRR